MIALLPVTVPKTCDFSMRNHKYRRSSSSILDSIQDRSSGQFAKALNTSSVSYGWKKVICLIKRVN